MKKTLIALALMVPAVAFARQDVYVNVGMSYNGEPHSQTCRYIMGNRSGVLTCTGTPIQSGTTWRITVQRDAPGLPLDRVDAEGGIQITPDWSSQISGPTDR